MTLPQANAPPGTPGTLVKHYLYDGVGRLICVQSPYPDPISAQSTNKVRSERIFYDGVRRVQELVTDPITDTQPAAAKIKSYVIESLARVYADQPEWIAAVIGYLKVRTHGMMWSIGYNGKEFDIDPGVDGVQSISEMASLDLSAMCPECFDGIRQDGPLRIPRSCFNGHKLVVEALQMLGWHPILVEEPFIERLDASLWAGVELREIELEGKGTAPNRWFQVIPSFELPIDKFIQPCYRVERCSTCTKGAWLVERRANIPLDEIVSSMWYHDDLTSIWKLQGFARTPYQSSGYEPRPSILRSSKDQRILDFPARGTVLGTDAANQIRALRDKRLKPEPMSLPLSEAPRQIQELYEIESKQLQRR